MSLFIDTDQGPLGINFWRQRTKDGWRIRYGVRGIGRAYDNFCDWLGKRNTVDHSDDWPWSYFSFADPADDEALASTFSEYLHQFEDDESAYVEPTPPTEFEMELSRILSEEITKAINEEILQGIKDHANGQSD